MPTPASTAPNRSGRCVRHAPTSKPPFDPPCTASPPGNMAVAFERFGLDALVDNVFTGWGGRAEETAGSNHVRYLMSDLRNLGHNRGGFLGQQV